MAITPLAIPGYRMYSYGGFAAPAWLAAESVSKLLPFQLDEQQEAANVQLLAELLRAHSAMGHFNSLAAEGGTILCRHFALARIGACIS